MRYLNFLLASLVLSATAVEAVHAQVKTPAGKTNLVAATTISIGTNAPATVVTNAPTTVETNATTKALPPPLSKLAREIENLKAIEELFGPKEPLSEIEAEQQNQVLKEAMAQTLLALELQRPRQYFVYANEQTLRASATLSMSYMASVSVLLTAKNTDGESIFPDLPLYLILKIVEASRAVAETKDSASKLKSDQFNILFTEKAKNQELVSQLLFITDAFNAALRDPIRKALERLKKEADDPAHPSKSISSFVTKAIRILEANHQKEEELKKEEPQNGEPGSPAPKDGKLNIWWGDENIRPSLRGHQGLNLTMK